MLTYFTFSESWSVLRSGIHTIVVVDSYFYSQRCSQLELELQERKKIQPGVRCKKLEVTTGSENTKSEKDPLIANLGSLTGDEKIVTADELPLGGAIEATQEVAKATELELEADDLGFQIPVMESGGALKAEC